MVIKKNSAVAVVRGRAPFPFAADAFDVVTALEVVEHVESDVDFLNQIGRVMKIGGQLVISVPSQKYPVSPKHKKHYTAYSLMQLFNAGNFTDLSFEVNKIIPYEHPRFYPVLKQFHIMNYFLKRAVSSDEVGLIQVEESTDTNPGDFPNTGNPQIKADGYFVLATRDKN